MRGKMFLRINIFPNIKILSDFRKFKHTQCSVNSSVAVNYHAYVKQKICMKRFILDRKNSNHNLDYKALCSCISICIYIYILAIAGRTAGPNGLNVFRKLMGVWGEGVT